MKNYYNFNLTNEQKQYAKETDDFLYELDFKEEDGDFVLADGLSQLDDLLDIY